MTQFYNASRSKAVVAIVDGNPIGFPEDSAQAMTTLHCNRKDALWRRRWVVEQKIPLEARRQWKQIDVQQASLYKCAQQKITDAANVIRFDAWYMGRDRQGHGLWAYHATVADGELVACEYISIDPPVLNGIMRKYGTYRNPSQVMKSADDVKFYVRTMSL